MIDLSGKGQESPHREDDPYIGTAGLEEHQGKMSRGQVDIDIWRVEEKSVLEIPTRGSLAFYSFKLKYS